MLLTISYFGTISYLVWCINIIIGVSTACFLYDQKEYSSRKLWFIMVIGWVYYLPKEIYIRVKLQFMAKRADYDN